MNNNILLIDDSITIHRVIDLSVDADKYSVSKVFSAEDARSKIRDEKPDIILLDNKLEGIKTQDFIRELKGELPEVKIILLVGAFDKMDESAIAKTGADDFLVKPFNSTSLEEKLKSFSLAEESTADTEEKIDFEDKDEAIEELMASIDEEKEPEDSKPKEIETPVAAEQPEESEDIVYSTTDDAADDESMGEELPLEEEESVVDEKYDISGDSPSDNALQADADESLSVADYSEETEEKGEILSEKQSDLSDEFDAQDKGEDEPSVDEVKRSEEDAETSASGAEDFSDEEEIEIDEDSLEDFFDGLEEVEADEEVEFDSGAESVFDENAREDIEEGNKTVDLSEALQDLVDEADEETEKQYDEDEIQSLHEEEYSEDVAKAAASEFGYLDEKEVSDEEKTQNFLMDKDTITDALREVLGEYNVEIDEKMVQNAVAEVLDEDFLKGVVSQILHDKLEKVIRDVVPELSEELILKEIEKLKESGGEDE